MSSVANPVAPPPEQYGNRAQIPWTAIAWFAALLILGYLPVLARLVAQWNNDEDMGHGFFVPIVALYVAWLNKDRFDWQARRTNPLGLAVVAFSALQLYIGTLGAELFLARTAFLEAVFGSVLYLGGFAAVRAFAFPMFLLCFMVPIPGVVYNQITFPLQLLASQIAAAILEIFGVPVLRDGNVLELPSQRLSVVEACSGIRSLLSLSFLSLVYGYFFDRRRWMRTVLFLSTVPIAIAANAGRVTLTGILSEINPELAHGFVHTASGWVIFMIALAMLAVWHRLLHLAAKLRGQNASK